VKSPLVALALAMGCGSNADGMTGADARVGTDGGISQPDGGSDAGSPPPSDAGIPPPPTSHWVRDSVLTVYGVPYVVFHSSQPGDLWLEDSDSSPSHEALYHRVAGKWVSVFQAFVRSPTSVWVRSPSEAWILEGGTIHIVGAAGSRDLVLPSGRYYSTIGDGWIAYFQPGQTVPANCSVFTNDAGVVGFLRITDSGLVDMPVPNLCSSSLPTNIYMGTAISLTGDVVSWNGSTWEVTAQLHGGGSDTFGLLSGSAPNDLYAVGAMDSAHFDGTTWRFFSFDATKLRAQSMWARPWGLKWGTSSTDAYKFTDGWQDRGQLPGSQNAGFSHIGSDGTDVFVTGEWVQDPVSPPFSIWIYRYSR